MTWTATGLRDFWVDLVYSDDGERAVRAMGHRYQLASSALDDLRQSWILGLDATLLRHADLVERLGEADAARRYAFSALRHRALDALRTARNRPDQVVASTAENAPSVLDLAESPERSDAAAMTSATLSDLRRAITARVVAGDVVCAGCRPAVVAQVALAVVDAYFDAAVTGRGEQVALAGGTTELDSAVYEGLRVAVPDAFVLDEQGRASERTRQLKSRCGRCVRQLLATVLQHPAESVLQHPAESVLQHPAESVLQHPAESVRHTGGTAGAEREVDRSEPRPRRGAG